MVFGRGQGPAQAANPVSIEDWGWKRNQPAGPRAGPKAGRIGPPGTSSSKTRWGRDSGAIGSPPRAAGSRTGTGAIQVTHDTADRRLLERVARAPRRGSERSPFP